LQQPRRSIYCFFYQYFTRERHMMTREEPPAAVQEPYLTSLNSAQRDAVLFGTEPSAGSLATRAPPLLVIAGAGSGKTNTLAHRVAHLVAQGADPGAILLLTFTNRAAEEMGRRVDRILGQMADCAKSARSAAVRHSIPWSGTFHSVGARLLREYAAAAALAPDFTIHDREDSADLMNLARHELGLSTREKRFPLKGTCLAIYSAVVNTGETLSAVLQSTFPWCAQWEDELKGLFLAYVQAKQTQQVLDYDDLLLYWARMVADADLALEIGARFEHVLVDEYQDTNRLQAAILLGMKPDGHGLTVVGDDAQSIYAFRGATVRNILDFPAQFSPPAHIVTLDRNYRSSISILAAANAVIALARERYAKDLWSDRRCSGKPRLVSVRDDADQAGFVVSELLARRERGVTLKSQAVLFRAAHHSARLELELTRRNIPFVKFGGLKFLEAAHVKDVIAILRWARNPRDRVSGFRAVQLVAGMGPRSAARLLEHVQGAPADASPLAGYLAPPSAHAAWPRFLALMDTIGHARATWPAPLEHTCQWYGEQMERLFDDARVRAGDIAQLARIGATYASMERFLTEITLEPPEATSDEAGIPLLDEDYVILSTIHSSKGREWACVSLLNCVDGCVPSDLATGTSAQIEEERRLLYVAMTRARDHLDLLLPQRFHTSGQSGLGDRHVYAGRTRFIPNSLLPHFESLSWPPATEFAASAPPARANLDLAAQMRAMWQ